MKSKTDHEVIVVGAGVSGIYQIKLLTDLGFDAIVLKATVIWVALGIVTAILAADSILRVTLTDILFRRKCWKSGIGKSVSLLSQKLYVT